MPAPEGLVISRVLPEEAGSIAQPLQGFFAETWHDLYVGEIGASMNVLANPNDINSVRRQADRIAASTDISVPDESAYVVARDPSQKRHSGIVGAAKLTRLEESLVEIDELDVDLSRRGERIGPAILAVAFEQLDVRAEDRLVLTALKQNVQGRAFWWSLRFRLTGRQVHHRDVFPDSGFVHLEYEGSLPLVSRSVGERLGSL
jgi:ribosomal protein S18 acetylase RimI-like enzyme